MKRWGIFALMCGALTALSAQEPADDGPPAGPAQPGPASPGGGGKKDEGPGAGTVVDPTVTGPILKRKKEPESVWQRKLGAPPVLNGIRFTFKDVPLSCQQGMYMLLSREKCAKVEPIVGLLGGRVPFPANRIVSIYDKPIENGAPQGKKILSSQIPQGFSEKVIGVVVPSTGDGFDLCFVDETQLKQGTVYLRNLTAEQIGMQIDKDKIINLKPGESQLFSPGFSNDGKNSHPAKMYRQDGEGKWYVSRQFTILCRKGESEIILVVWNGSIEKPDLQKISIADEKFEKPQTGATPGRSAAARSSTTAPAAGS